MAKTLKSQNRWRLALVLTINIGIFLICLRASSMLDVNVEAFVRHAKDYAPGAVAALLAGLLTDQLSAESKCRLIFLRWQHPLPACRAFSEHMHRDSRIDTACLIRQHAPLPTDPAQQNSLWYRIYRGIKEDPSVVDAHRSFLFNRDYALLAVMLLLALGTAALFQFPSAAVAWAYIGLLAVQGLLAWRAARVSGLRFVTTVLAISSAESGVSRD